MYKILHRYAGKYAHMIVLCVLLTAVEVACELTIPLLMARIVDIGIPSQDLRYMARVGGVMLAVATLAIVMGVLNARFSADASQGFAANLRQSLFDQTQRFSFSNIDRFSGASLITRMTSDVTRLQNTLMMSLRILTRAPIMLVSAWVVAMTINLRLSLIIVLSVLALALGAVLIGRAAGALFTLLQQRLDDLNGTVQENLIAIRVVKAFVREARERVKFDEANDNLYKVTMQVGNVIAVIMPLMMTVLYATTIAVIWLGGRYVGAGSMTAGELISFLSYIMQILMSVMMFAMIFIMLVRARACADRALEVLEAEPDIRDATDAAAPAVGGGLVEFRDVSFRYGESAEDVLSHISFTARPGEFVGIIGGTGSGKTSLVNLIPRFYDATSGAVLLDGTDVRAYPQKALRDSIGMVLQKNNLFTGTILENLLWGNENASTQQVEQAARNAQAHDFITSFPDGYQTELGQGGVNVSGGQKQRLCIARAILKAPAVLILDDSTSAVDTATEARIRQSLRENLSGTTVLVVAQRITSVQYADKIIVLDDGRISGIGTHQELLQENAVYREICQSQEGSVA